MKTIYENENQCVKISAGMFYDADSAAGVQYNSYQAFIPVENLPKPRMMFVSKFGVHGGIYDFNNTINQIRHFLSFEKDIAESEYQPILSEIRAAMKAEEEKPCPTC